MLIKRRDKVPDVTVVELAGAVSVEALITAPQLQYAGHVCRMCNDGLPNKCELHWKVEASWSQTAPQGYVETL